MNIHEINSCNNFKKAVRWLEEQGLSLVFHNADIIEAEAGGCQIDYETIQLKTKDGNTYDMTSEIDVFFP